ncbi:MAG TPA: acyl-CoA dehydrogenase family protein, partial [Nevskiaceae bacterium]|nr:acyl-CoA dehydrogenase family protein [Nevskiaceae bacterium]
YGGLGLGAVELALVQEQAGRRLLCAPYFSSVCLAANALRHCATAAAREKYLPLLAQGALRATMPLGRADAAQAVRTTQGWKLESDALHVPDGADAQLLLVPARIDDQLTALFALEPGTPGMSITPLQSWDATRRFARVELRGVALPQQARIDEAPRAAVGWMSALALARLCIAAEALGGAQACLDLAVNYTGTRKQFGRAIASFQAVKHRCAEMRVKVEALRSAVYGAAALAASGAPVEDMAQECAMAKALSADTFFWCAQEAIQLHGGVGFTAEYDPQLYFKRAQASSHWLGDATALRERIARRLFEAAPHPHS